MIESIRKYAQKWEMETSKPQIEILEWKNIVSEIKKHIHYTLRAQ